jgi:putative DNA primase/helicase
MRFRDALDRLPDARRCSSGWIARCPAHDDHHPSLSIREAENGDALLKCFASCEYESIIHALLGGPVEHPFNLSSGAGRPALDDATRIALARGIWHESLSAAGTAAERYLRSRNVTIPVPVTLRFHPSLRHPSGACAPAMVAAIQNREGRIIGVHRTFLSVDGPGKSHLVPQRAALGPIRGCAIRFAKAGERIALGEGIETCLSVAQARPDLEVWSAISASNLPCIELPDAVREVVICADGDEPGERAARKLGVRLLTENRRVWIARSGKGIDFNDLLCGAGRAADEQ